MCAITEGAGYVDYRGAAHFTPTGTLHLVAPGEVHANWATGEGCSYRNMYVPVPLLMDEASQLEPSAGAAPSFPSVLIEDSSVLESFLSLHQAMVGSTSQLRRDSLLLDFLALLASRSHMEVPVAEATGQESLAVRRAQEFLDEHYDQPVSLKDLAQLADLSPYYFHRSFCREKGIPPHAYQMQVRIARAKSLLRENWPISRVAFATGFADQSHFTRHFKRIVGVTPAQYFRPGKNVQDRLAV